MAFIDQSFVGHFTPTFTTNVVKRIASVCVTKTKGGIEMSEVKEGEYKGKPILIIRQGPEDKFPFQFGVKKAKLILEHIEDIKAFVTDHSND